MRGNALAMRAYFGLTTRQATKYAGKWIAVPSSNPGYATVSEGVTFPSFLSRLFPQETKLSVVTAGGLIGIHGTVKGEGGATAAVTIFRPAQGKPLPVKQTAKSSGHPDSGLYSMSRWGEAVHVSAPDGAVPIDTVVGG